PVGDDDGDERHERDDLEGDAVAEGAAAEEAAGGATVDGGGYLIVEVGRGGDAVQAGQGAHGALEAFVLGAAAGAAGEMCLELAGPRIGQAALVVLREIGFEGCVEVVGHGPYPICFASFSLSASRARWRRDLTVPSGRPVMAQISS